VKADWRFLIGLRFNDDSSGLIFWITLIVDWRVAAV